MTQTLSNQSAESCIALTDWAYREILGASVGQTRTPHLPDYQQLIRNGNWHLWIFHPMVAGFHVESAPFYGFVCFDQLRMLRINGTMMLR